MFFADGQAKPLLSFAPASPADEMAIAIDMAADDYYQTQAVQLQAPAFRGLCRSRVDDRPLRVPIRFGFSLLAPPNLSPFASR